MEPQMTPSVQTGSGKGFLIATILLIAVIAAGAVYFWHERSVKNMNAAPAENSTGATLEIKANLNATSSAPNYDTDESNYNAS